MKPIVLMHVAVSSGLIIMLLNSFIMVLLSTESFTYTIVNLFKIGVFGVFYRQSVNYGIYSCNWTNMDLKFKKLLLLTMQINEANEIMMKASTKKIVNLQLFANVLMTSYNIVSVMVKTISK